MSLFETLLRPVLFRMDAEQAHTLALTALSSGLAPPARSPLDRRLEVSLAGLKFPNPIGMAAGFDKNAVVPDALLSRGFGFVEVGTVTPRPQAGNPRPRVFRLEQDRAVINRLGFNNDGKDAALARLTQRRGARRVTSGVVGVNIGANKDSQDFGADYETGLTTFWEVADYFTVNISSPNTPGLRDLQAGEALGGLMTRLMERRQGLIEGSGHSRPIFVKIAPDLDNRQMDEVARAIEGKGVDGLIVSNTTLSRTGIGHSRFIAEAGGLSGRPLFTRSTIVLARMRERVGDLPIIGVGGIENVETAVAKLEAGANLIQLYTGMIYHGITIAAEINRDLVTFMNTNGISGLAELTGRRTGEWASKKLPEES